MFNFAKTINLTCRNDYDLFAKELSNILSTQNTPANIIFTDYFCISVYINEIELESKSPDKRLLVPKVNITKGKNEHETKIDISFGITSFVLLFSGLALLLVLMVFNKEYKFQYYELFFVILLALYIFLLRRNLSYCVDQLKCLKLIINSMKEIKSVHSISKWNIKFQSFNGKYL